MSWKNRLPDNRRYLGFNDWPLIIVGVPVIGAFFSMFLFGFSFRESLLCFYENAFACIFFTTVFWLGDRQISILLRKKFPQYSQVRKRLYIQSLLILIYTLLMSVILFYCQDKFSHEFIGEVKHPGFFRAFLASFFPTLAVTTIYEAAYFIDRWKDSVAETERLRKENIQAQLDALKSHVNPHFLFNSLNTLASIIPEDPQRSVEFVQKLSNVYRCILDIRERQAVTLEEELQCLESYLFLLQTRFGENISFDIHTDETSRKKFLVPLSLQMLVENAVKHNIVSQRRPLRVNITAGEHEVVVSNNLQVKDQETHGSGTGLHNIGDRFRLTFGRNIKVSDDAASFRVALPLIPIAEYHST